MQLVAISWHVYELTNSPVSLGIVGIVGFLPIVFFGIFGGLIADTFPRKKIIIVTQTLFFLNAFFLWFLTATHHINPLAIYIILFFNATIASIDMPVRSAILPTLAPPLHLKGAVNLLTLTRQISLTLGSMIVGFLIAWYGPQSAYLLNALSFLCMLLIAFHIHIPHVITERKVFLDINALKEGLRFIFNTPLIYSTMLLDFFVSFFGSATILIPVFAKTVLYIPVQQLGFLYAAPTIGSILAGIVVSSMKKMPQPGKVLLIAVIIFGLATIGFGLSHILLVSLFFLAIVGASDTVSTMIRNVVRQSLTPDVMRGRMTGIVMIFFTGGPYLGDAEAGLVAGLIGGPLSVITGGVGAVLAAVGIWKIFPQIRRYKD